MFLELIAVVFAGVAMAGLAMFANKLTGGRLPRWFTPVAAGGGMIAVTISSEYGWYGRTAQSLPEGVEVVQTVENQSFYRPWTYIKPYTERFVAVDLQSIQSNSKLPDLHIADIYFFGRWAPVNKLPVLFDCQSQRRANLVDGAEFAEDGTVLNARWVPVAADDPLTRAICDRS